MTPKGAAEERPDRLRRFSWWPQRGLQRKGRTGYGVSADDPKGGCRGKAGPVTAFQLMTPKGAAEERPDRLRRFSWWPQRGLQRKGRTGYGVSADDPKGGCRGKAGPVTAFQLMTPKGAAEERPDRLRRFSWWPQRGLQRKGRTGYGVSADDPKGGCRGKAGPVTAFQLMTPKGAAEERPDRLRRFSWWPQRGLQRKGRTGYGVSADDPKGGCRGKAGPVTAFQLMTPKGAAEERPDRLRRFSWWPQRGLQRKGRTGYGVSADDPKGGCRGKAGPVTAFQLMTPKGAAEERPDRLRRFSWWPQRGLQRKGRTGYGVSADDPKGGCRGKAGPVTAFQLMTPKGAAEERPDRLRRFSWWPQRGLQRKGRTGYGVSADDPKGGCRGKAGPVTAFQLMTPKGAAEERPDRLRRFSWWPQRGLQRKGRTGYGVSADDPKGGCRGKAGPVTAFQLMTPKGAAEERPDRLRRFSWWPQRGLQRKGRTGYGVSADDPKGGCRGKAGPVTAFQLMTPKGAAEERPDRLRRFSWWPQRGLQRKGRTGYGVSADDPKGGCRGKAGPVTAFQLMTPKGAAEERPDRLRRFSWWPQRGLQRKGRTGYGVSADDPKGGCRGKAGPVTLSYHPFFWFHAHLFIALHFTCDRHTRSHLWISVFAFSWWFSESVQYFLVSFQKCSCRLTHWPADGTVLRLEFQPPHLTFQISWWPVARLRPIRHIMPGGRWLATHNHAWCHVFTQSECIWSKKFSNLLFSSHTLICCDWKSFSLLCNVVETLWCFSLAFRSAWNTVGKGQIWCGPH